MRQFVRLTLGLARYGLARLQGRPYFGSFRAAQQTNPKRAVAMRHLVQQEKPQRILEVGSWAGQSAILWASSAPSAVVYCVDAWQPYSSASSAMQRALSHQRILPLFLYNVRAAGVEDRIRILRGSSQEILPLLTDATFDLVFLDGDHAYRAVQSDIREARRLVRQGGIVCGDDLQLQAAQVNRANAEANREQDYIVDPGSVRWYHPGVTLAVEEAFGPVSASHGFWAMRKTEGGWKLVTLQEH